MPKIKFPWKTIKEASFTIALATWLYICWEYIPFPHNVLQSIFIIILFITFKIEVDENE